MGATWKCMEPGQSAYHVRNEEDEGRRLLLPMPCQTRFLENGGAGRGRVRGSARGDRPWRAPVSCAMVSASTPASGGIILSPGGVGATAASASSREKKAPRTAAFGSC